MNLLKKMTSKKGGIPGSIKIDASANESICSSTQSVSSSKLSSSNNNINRGRERTETDYSASGCSELDYSAADYSATSLLDGMEELQDEKKDGPFQGPETQPRKPHESTYWISKYICAGINPTSKDGDELETRALLRRFLKRGIVTFIDLAPFEEHSCYNRLLQEEASNLGLSFSEDVELIRFACPDFGVPTKHIMKEILNALDRCVKQRSKVYIHSQGGTGRTGTAIGCYMVRHGSTGDEALRELHRLFQTSALCKDALSSPETDGQVAYVMEWEQGA